MTFLSLFLGQQWFLLWLTVFITEVVLQAVLDHTNTHLLQQQWINFLYFFHCHMGLSFHLM